MFREILQLTQAHIIYLYNKILKVNSDLPQFRLWSTGLNFPPFLILYKTLSCSHIKKLKYQKEKLHPSTSTSISLKLSDSESWINTKFKKGRKKKVTLQQKCCGIFLDISLKLLVYTNLKENKNMFA